jgi:hypothetical protein
MTVCSEVFRSILDQLAYVAHNKCLASSEGNACAMSNSLPHIPIQTRSIDLIFILAETYIQHWSSVLKLLQELSLAHDTVLVSEVVQINVLVP